MNHLIPRALCQPSAARNHQRKSEIPTRNPKWIDPLEARIAPAAVVSLLKNAARDRHRERSRTIP
jgi:hypothetical protein